MRTRNRDRELEQQQNVGGDGGTDDQAALRARGDALLAAADAAISRALSRNSAEFLAQNRQSGGQ